MNSMSDISFEKPTQEDGSPMWELVKKTSLDLNSPYKYILMSEYFADTCLVAKNNGSIIGFITAFISPERQDCLFVWQVGVDPIYQGKKIASNMLHELLSRQECKQIRYLEATITPTNVASQSLFNKIARDYETDLCVTEFFPAHIFPNDNKHDEELLYRVGPFPDY